MSKKRIYSMLLALAVSGICFWLLALLVQEIKGKDDVMISKETEPIYNHFPDLPETSEIEWCSRSKGGLGLVNHWLYIFAFYDHDVSGELQEMTVEDACEDMEWYYMPDKAKGQSWKSVENAHFAFQSDIAEYKKMSTKVSINETGTILYVEAYWD